MPIKAVVSTLTGITAVGSGIVGISYWYSLPANLKHILLNKGVKLLNVESTTNNKEWEKLANKYKGNSAMITIKDNKKINKIGSFRIPEPSGGEEINFELLKQECKKLFAKPVKKDKDFEDAEQNAKNWCSSDSVLLKDTDLTSNGS